ncbi:MAG: hypothetical protein J6K52_06195 [Clostridia bacterium]|nr:hypothetical protein [Clostridia bacterium]
MKKLFSLLLVIMLVAMAFVSCGCSNDEEPETTETDTSTTGPLVPDPELPSGVTEDVEHDNVLDF